MIAKLITHGPTRDGAAAALAAACGDVQVWPVKTNAAFLARALKHPGFLAGDIDTGFIERYRENLVPAATPSEAVLQASRERDAVRGCDKIPGARLLAFG